MRYIYHRLDENDFVIESKYSEENIPDWVQGNIVENLIKPKYNKTTKKFYEGATSEEIENYNSQLIPKLVSQRQLRTQLVLNGFNLDSIQTAINSLSEPNKSIAQIAWDYAITFERDSPLLMCLATNLGLTQIEVDEIFLNASKL